MKKSSRDIVFSYLGAARLEPFRVETSGNDKEALNPYRWSISLNAAVQETIGIVEVVLRNAIDEQLQEWNNQKQGEQTSWLLKAPSAPLRAMVEGKRIESVRRATKEHDRRPQSHRKHGRPLTHDDVLANTMFGLWKDILPNHAVDANSEKPENQNRMNIWKEATSHAFPHVIDPDGERTYWRVAHLHLLRNRVSHMDSLLNADVEDVIVNDAFGLVGSIDPVLRDWVTGVSTVSQILRKDPRKQR